MVGLKMFQRVYKRTLCVVSMVYSPWSTAWSTNYGPRARCGPRSHFVNDEKI